mmetsp:Transcript_7061/g.12209  ORF Transcript_7061/g.12209 Transcript_7061/m.12209 type:complete len:538 (+) Transcript_7061:351-1964(+)|eukprot:CAMPEP_0198209006 /NCGR_PEP_ID=MMETSP1445-20131203/12333_1 /TAXON_ID=36898 /ORGANISM="Pyramimonas sp., Strain CCMP2087" /LENGTH=537 /DNA_ID=CAMNT_0043882621 /DNA_START=294 /DNA_END=1907 /DNA_ORIENTATION=+
MGLVSGLKEALLGSAKDKTPANPAAHRSEPSDNGKAARSDPIVPGTSVAQSAPPKSHAEQTQGGKPAQEKVDKRSTTNMAITSREFFPQLGESSRYTLMEIMGKGSYGVVCSATDNNTGEKVAIKKITDVFEHVSDATRILREIKLLRYLKHADIVQIKHIMLPSSPTDFKEVYVVFELMESDLHQVIKANDDLTSAHYIYFMYQLICGMHHIHSANVFHRDLKPKNILANSDCKLKICDFGLARPAFDDQPSTVFWTDYVATRWYRAPELCGSFFTKYTPAIDVWGLGCILAELILGKPLFPGRNVSHQLQLITNLVGTPTEEQLAKVRNEKARTFLANLPFKEPVPFERIFLGIDPGIISVIEAMLRFDPCERCTIAEALESPIFDSYRMPANEMPATPVSKLAFDFECRKLTKEDVRHLIYLEILEYHPSAKEDYLDNTANAPNFVYPSAVDRFRKQFGAMEEAAAGAGGGSGAKYNQNSPMLRATNSLPKERIRDLNDVDGMAPEFAGRTLRSESISERISTTPDSIDIMDTS